MIDPFSVPGAIGHGLQTGNGVKNAVPGQVPSTELSKSRTGQTDSGAQKAANFHSVFGDDGARGRGKQGNETDARPEPQGAGPDGDNTSGATDPLDDRVAMTDQDGATRLDAGVASDGIRSEFHDAHRDIPQAEEVAGMALPQSRTDVATHGVVESIAGQSGHGAAITRPVQAGDALGAVGADDIGRTPRRTKGAVSISDGVRLAAGQDVRARDDVVRETRVDGPDSAQKGRATPDAPGVGRSDPAALNTDVSRQTGAEHPATTRTEGLGEFSVRTNPRADAPRIAPGLEPVNGAAPGDGSTRPGAEPAGSRVGLSVARHIPDGGTPPGSALSNLQGGMQSNQSHGAQGAPSGRDVLPDAHGVVSAPRGGLPPFAQHGAPPENPSASSPMVGSTRVATMDPFQSAQGGDRVMSSGQTAMPATLFEPKPVSQSARDVWMPASAPGAGSPLSDAFLSSAPVLSPARTTSPANARTLATPGSPEALSPVGRDVAAPVGPDLRSEQGVSRPIDVSVPAPHATGSQVTTATMPNVVTPGMPPAAIAATAGIVAARQDVSGLPNDADVPGGIEDLLPGDMRAVSDAARPGHADARIASRAVDIARQLSARITAGGPLGAGGSRTLEVSLNPAELGRVRLSMNTGDNAMMVTIAADRPETLELMRRNIDVLAQEFRDMGYDSTAFAFGERAAGQGGASTDRDQGAAGPDLAAPVSEPGAPMVRAAAMVDGLDIRL